MLVRSAPVCGTFSFVAVDHVVALVDVLTPLSTIITIGEVVHAFPLTLYFRFACCSTAVQPTTAWLQRPVEKQMKSVVCVVIKGNTNFVHDRV